MKQSSCYFAMLIVTVLSSCICNSAADPKTKALAAAYSVVYSRDGGAPGANQGIFNPGRQSLSAQLRGAGICCPEVREEIVSCYSNPDCAQYCCIGCGFGTTIYNYFSTFNPGETESLLYLPAAGTFAPLVTCLGCALCDQLVRTKTSWCSSLTKFICGLNGMSEGAHEE